MKKKIKKKQGKLKNQSSSKKIKKGTRKKKVGPAKKEKKEKIFISADGKLKQRFMHA